MDAHETYLETERLRLRPFTAVDVHLLMDLDSDPEVVRFVKRAFAPPVHAEYEAMLRRWLDLARRWQGRFGYWAALLKEEGDAFAGWFHLRPAWDDPDNARVVELGYRLRRICWGRGLATEGSRALIHKALTELGVDQVFATTVEANLASRRVMEKAGLSFVEAFEDRFPDGFTVRAVRYARARR